MSLSLRDAGFLAFDAGFYGAVIAERIACDLGQRVVGERVHRLDGLGVAFELHTRNDGTRPKSHER